MSPTRSNPLFAVAAVLVAAAAWAGGPLVIEAEGTAVVTGGDKAAAAQQATHAAQVNAVGEALTQRKGSADSAEGLLEEHGAELIKSSQVLHQDVDGHILTVKVSVGIDLAVLSKLAKVSATPSRGTSGSPAHHKILVLATEQLGPGAIVGWSDVAFSVGPGSVSASSKAHLVQLVDQMGGLEATLAQAFTSAGYEVIDPSVLKGKLPKAGLTVVDLTAPQAQEIARTGGADIVIVANGRSAPMYHEALAESGMHSGSGNVVARMIRVSDGRVLSSSTQQGAKVHLDPQTAQILALNEAGKAASAELLRAIASP